MLISLTVSYYLNVIKYLKLKKKTNNNIYVIMMRTERARKEKENSEKSQFAFRVMIL